jgi:hypothetical protein
VKVETTESENSEATIMMIIEYSHTVINLDKIMYGIVQRHSTADYDVQWRFSLIFDGGKENQVGVQDRGASQGEAERFHGDDSKTGVCHPRTESLKTPFQWPWFRAVWQSSQLHYVDHHRKFDPDAL